MHELSIAQNIVEIVQQNVPEKDRPRVRSVVTIVGEQSGVVADSLLFSFQAITAATDLERSHLQVEEVPFTIRCKDCNCVAHADAGNVQCLSCNSINTEILGGTDLRVREIVLDD